MENQALKKYSPLGLLALAIVAGVVAFIQHQENEDAGYDVITYLHCKDESLTGGYKALLSEEMVIIREDDGFEVLKYDFILGRGEPKDLSYFSRVPTRKFRESPLRFDWEQTVPPGLVVQQGQTMAVILWRRTGSMRRIYNGRKANTPGCGGYDGCLAAERYAKDYRCKFGEEAKKLVWANAVANYKSSAPKF
jgi:hypothetical protein